MPAWTKSASPARQARQILLQPEERTPIFTLARSFHLGWKESPDSTHHSRNSAFSQLDTGFRHGPSGPTHQSNHKTDRITRFACSLHGHFSRA